MRKLSDIMATNKQLQKQRLSARYRPGLSIIEILIALSIAALLLTATAVAFDAAFRNYQANCDMTTTSVSCRNSLYQMTSTIRSAWNGGDDPNSPVIEVYDDGTGDKCSLVDADGRDVIYWHKTATRQLQVSIDGGNNWYAMVDDVDPITADEPVFTAVAPDNPGFSEGTLGKVIIRFKVQHNGTSYPITATAVPRNIIY